jgi:hypothetical protein
MKHYVFAHTTDTDSAERIEHIEEFNDYDTAMDYYRDTFKNQSEQLVDNGGEHIIMLYTKENNYVRVLKRHTISTTFNKIEDND